jgi:hypothetical protein
MNRSGGGVVVGDGSASLLDLVPFGDAVTCVGLEAPEDAIAKELSGLARP